MPSKAYIAMLDIKATVRKWQDLTINDKTALAEIEKIIINLQKQEWKDSH